jgi:prephenate dehydrogenase
MWQQILLANSVQTLKALGDFERVLTAIRQAVESGDRDRLASILAEGKSRRDALGS